MEHTPKKNWHAEAQRIIRKIADATKANMIMYGIGILFLIIIIFQAGLLVGSRKEHYLERAGGDVHPITKRLPAAHGTTGTIIFISPPNITVADDDNIEKTIFTKDTTIIRGAVGDLPFSELKMGDVITAIGTPTPGGSILANFIRIMPQ